MAEKVKSDEARTVSFKVPKISGKVWAVSTVLLLALSGFLFFRQGGNCPTGASVMSANAAGSRAVDYINDNLVDTGSAALVSAEDMGEMYKITTEYNGNNIDVYVTKGGKLLFVSGAPYDMTAAVPTTTTQPKKTCDDMEKADAAELEAYVVSYCPYGLQMQRILAEIVENIPSLEGSIKVRYIGAVVDGKVTAMHGDVEAQENLRQICIREEQADKYWDYVSCFMKKQDASGSCLAQTAVDAAKLSACMADGGKGVDYAKADFDLADSNGVSGSPTLIMNGETVSEFDFGGRTAEAVKTLLCCGFSAEPTACFAELNTAQAATSFSESYSSGATTAASSCG